MRTDYYYPSCGAGAIHVCRWMPEGEIKAVVQIVHGIGEYVERYDELAQYLNSRGILVVAEDHMGHGKSVGGDGVKGYFHGGWFVAVDDTYHLLQETQKEFSRIPYILFGHSMGSFLTRSLLCRYPKSGISAAIISGTGWQPGPAVTLGKMLSSAVCKLMDEKKPSRFLQSLCFAGYNRMIRKSATKMDWLTRDAAVVAAYVADPMCGYTIASAGLLRDMMDGIAYNQRPEQLAKMNKQLPVLFIAGSGDPVADYGKAVHRTAEAFVRAGMECVCAKIYPDCRHELHNELNKAEIFEDVLQWMQPYIM